MKRFLSISVLLATLSLVSCGGSSNEGIGGQAEERQGQRTAPVEGEAPAAAERAEATPMNPTEFEVTIAAVGNNMRDMKYDKVEIRVPPNSRITLKLENQGEDASMVHNIVIIYGGTLEATAKAAIEAGQEKNYVPDMRSVIAASPLAGPGETVEFEFDAHKPGTYEFVCTFPGHAQKMNGKFIVEPAGA